MLFAILGLLFELVIAVDITISIPQLVSHFTKLEKLIKLCTKAEFNSMKYVH